jgi:hypothetical protein
MSSAAGSVGDRNDHSRVDAALWITASAGRRGACVRESAGTGTEK